MDESVQILETLGSSVINRTVDVVSAYVSNNSLPLGDLTALIHATHATLAGLGNLSAPAAPSVEKPTPAQIKKSVTHEAITSFEDGKPYKTLRRHLTLRGLTPETYREKWGLPWDYPVTSAGYSAQRSELARSLGLGQQRRKSPPVSPKPAAETEKPKRPGRTRKAKEPAEA